MIVLTYDQFVNAIVSKKSTVVYFYEGHASLDYSDTSIRPFNKIVATTGTEELVEKLKEFAATYPHKFSTYIHNSDNGVQRKGYFLHVDLSVKAVAVAVPIQNAEVLDKASMKAEILRELTEVKKHDLLVKDLEIANAKLKQGEFMSEKLAAVGIQLLTQLGVIDPTAGVMQGLQPEGTNSTPATTTSETAVTNIDEALALFRQKLGDETIIKLARKIEANGALIETLKTFAG